MIEAGTGMRPSSVQTTGIGDDDGAVMWDLGGRTTVATPAYAASLVSAAAGDAPETALPEEYHIFDPDMPWGPSHGCTVENGVLTFDSEAARNSVRDYRIFPPSGGDAGSGAGTGTGAAWEAVQLAWTCDLMSADVLKTLDPLKLSAVSSPGMDATSDASPPVPDVHTLMHYSPEHGALRMWPEVYDKCLLEISRLTWNDCPERAAVLERLRARTSRLFVFAHRLLAAYRRRLGEATSHAGSNPGGINEDDEDGDSVSALRERLDAASRALADERAARATAAARVVSLEAELAKLRELLRVSHHS